MIHIVEIKRNFEITSEQRKQLILRAKNLGYDFDKASDDSLIERLLIGCIQDAIEASRETDY